jgi:hypothetical protein
MTQHSQTAVKLALPRQFREIRLELAREPGHPAGSRQHGYRLIAPLDAEGRIGHLIRRGTHWAFHYDIKGTDDDEGGYRFSDERFVVGEYVSIHEAEGLRTFQVTSVEHL